VTWTTGVPQLRRLAFELAAAPWMAEAPCRGSSVAFFVDDGIDFPRAAAQRRVTYAEARRICSTCPLTEPCLEYALASHAEYGVWGGLDPVERRALERERRQRRNRVSA
jgi:WhiB family redox-sensing transcriptional regulator